MDFNINLKAGVWSRQDTRGRMFLLIDPGAAGSIELLIDLPGQNDERVSTAKKNFSLTLKDGYFDGVLMRAAVDTTAQIIISENDVAYNIADGATINAVIQGLPLAVSNDRGTPGNLLYVSGVSLADTPATSITNGAAVACGPAAVVVAAANANRRAIRFTNLGPDPVALGAAGLTWAARCIVLEVGDSWNEDRAANLAWAGITDIGKAASVTRQEVTA